MSAGALLAMYRQRGKAEGHMGELMSVVAPAQAEEPLSRAARPPTSPSAACAPAQGPYLLQRLRQTELVNKRGLHDSVL